jgi:putative flippase GtrA
MLTLFKFSIIGFISTLIHILSSLFFFKITNLIYLSNFFGFSNAVIFSFAGHYIYTFKSKSSIKKTIIKFFFISLSSLIINQLSLVFLINLGLTKSTSIIIGSLFIPIYSFILSKYWVFNK